MKRALITGIGGQDGTYLARLLAAEGYAITGLTRNASSVDRRLLPEGVDVVLGDVADRAMIHDLVAQCRPDEIYNLASDSFGPRAWDEPFRVGETMGLGAVSLMDAMRVSVPHARFFQASSSEMFGHPVERPQRETTALQPRTPYAAAKAYAHWMVGAYRTRFGLFGCSGILYNHESPLRRPEFVTRKITSAVAAIQLGSREKLPLGNLDVRRDWGFAGDYVRAMWLMLQQETADDYVISAGETHSVRELCEIAFSEAGLDYPDHVVCDERFVRHDDPEPVGDPSRARERLGWTPAVSFRELVAGMVAADVARLRGEVPSVE